jgi:hypothetical protein
VAKKKLAEFTVVASYHKNGSTPGLLSAGIMEPTICHFHIIYFYLLDYSQTGSCAFDENHTIIFNE